jgi:hypothetical protein
MLWRAPTDLSETSGGVVVLDERCPLCTMSGWILPVDVGALTDEAQASFPTWLRRPGVEVG